MSDGFLRVVTLHQPWASLVLAGAKTFETRSWKPPAGLIGQPLAIHAGRAAARDLPPAIADSVRGILGADWIDTVPRGRLLCTATVGGAWRTGHRHPDGTISTVARVDGSPVLTSFREDHFGDYAPDRWIWRLDDVAPLPPIEIRGRQGIWRLPASALAA